MMLRSRLSALFLPLAVTMTGMAALPAVAKPGVKKPPRPVTVASLVKIGDCADLSSDENSLAKNGWKTLFAAHSDKNYSILMTNKGTAWRLFVGSPDKKNQACLGDMGNNARPSIVPVYREQPASYQVAAQPISSKKQIAQARRFGLNCGVRTDALYSRYRDNREGIMFSGHSVKGYTAIFTASAAGEAGSWTEITTPAADATIGCIVDSGSSYRPASRSTGHPAGNGAEPIPTQRQRLDHK